TDINGNAAHSVFTRTCGLDVIDEDSTGRILSLAGLSGATVVEAALPPAGSLLLSPTNVSATTGSAQAITIAATDSAGAPAPGVHIDLQVSGQSLEHLLGITNANGKVTLSDTRYSPGTDRLRATGFIDGMLAASNDGQVIWTGGTVTPPPPPTDDGGDGG